MYSAPLLYIQYSTRIVQARRMGRRIVGTMTVGKRILAARVVGVRIPHEHSNKPNRCHKDAFRIFASRSISMMIIG
jgi:hypothetical protein